MPDREKIIKGLESLHTRLLDVAMQDSVVMLDVSMVANAIALLKEQGAVRPEREHSGGGTTWWNVCGNCKTAINPNDKFCHYCGKAVKWND